MEKKEIQKVAREATLQSNSMEHDPQKTAPYPDAAVSITEGVSKPGCQDPYTPAKERIHPCRVDLGMVHEPSRVSGKQSLIGASQ